MTAEFSKRLLRACAEADTRSLNRLFSEESVVLPTLLTKQSSTEWSLKLRNGRQAISHAPIEHALLNNHLAVFDWIQQVFPNFFELNKRAVPRWLALAASADASASVRWLCEQSGLRLSPAAQNSKAVQQAIKSTAMDVLHYFFEEWPSHYHDLPAWKHVPTEKVPIISLLQLESDTFRLSDWHRNEQALAYVFSVSEHVPEWAQRNAASLEIFSIRVLEPIAVFGFGLDPDQVVSSTYLEARQLLNLAAASGISLAAAGLLGVLPSDFASTEDQAALRRFLQEQRPNLALSPIRSFLDTLDVPKTVAARKKYFCSAECLKISQLRLPITATELDRLLSPASSAPRHIKL